LFVELLLMLKAYVFVGHNNKELTYLRTYMYQIINERSLKS